MKSAALIFGVIAGLLGAGVLVFGNIDSSLAAATDLGRNHDTVAKLIAYLVPAIAWLGAGLALSHPRLGGLVLLLSAAGWAAIAFILGHGTVFFAAAPFTFAAAAGLVALFARRSPMPRATPLGPPETSGAVSDVIDAGQPTRRQSDAISTASVPVRADARRSSMREGDAGDFDVRSPRIPPPFLDIVPDEQPGGDVETITPALVTPLPIEVAEPSPRPGEVENLPPIVAAPAEANVAVVPAPHPRRPGEWTLPTPVAPAQPASPRYAADRQAPIPSRLEPLAPATLPAADQRPRGVSTLDFGATNDLSAHRDAVSDRNIFAAADETGPGTRFGRRDDADEAPAFESDTADGSPGRGSGVRRVVRLLIALLFIIILLGIAAAIYLDYRRGAQSILFGRHPHLTETTGTTADPAPPLSQMAPANAAASRLSVPATPSPVPDAVPQPAAIHRLIPAAPVAPPPEMVASPPKPPTASPGAPVALAATTPVPLAPAAPASRPTAASFSASPAADATQPPTVGTPTEVKASNDAVGTYADPISYCAAIGTVDAPETHYTGPAVPNSVAAALLLPQSTPADQLHWRCADGAAFACNARHTNACMPTPTVEGMLKYCALHPGAANLPAPNGTWSCNGARPVIPDDQSWPVDPQGFFPGAWIRVSPVG